jgi:DNA helicase-4
VQPLGVRGLQVESPDELPTIKAIQEIATRSELKFLLCDLNAPESEFQKFRSHGLSVATQVRKLLDCGSLEAADRIVEQSSKYIAAQLFKRERARVIQELEKQGVRREREEEHQRLELERKRAAIEAQLSAALTQSVSEADAINRAINAEGVYDYSTLKSKYLSGWLKQRYESQPFSREQIDAIGEMSDAFLLMARAGSGKTTVINAKAALLMEHEAVVPDRLMILAFNQKAAKEVTKGIRRDYGLIDFDNARTFHSLAYQLVQPQADLLSDESGGGINAQKQSAFVQRLLNSVMNPALLAQIYLFFRSEMQELEDIGAFLSPDDYYAYRRSHVQETLNGQLVKSAGEKWIADFLFEHGVKYAYERLWFWDGHNYRPDFSLFVNGPAPNIVIEHWGIDLNDPSKKVPEHWVKSWEDYRKELERKRDYWRRHNEANRDRPVLFLETSVADMRRGRESFEEVLAHQLRQAGFPVQRLPESDLRERVVTQRIGRFSSMCLQYIQKAKKQRLSPAAMADRIAAEKELSVKTGAFLAIANNLYGRYERSLSAENKIDFDGLMNAAIDRVHQTKGECEIRIEGDRFVTMNQLDWILVDEYQDCSRLFYDLVDSIRTYNKNVRLFCVGDDWQAINAFAGSDLLFFSQFRRLIDGARTGHLQNNYRSARQIVDLGNSFMQGKGKPSIPKRDELRGSFQICHTDKVWIEQRPGAEWVEERAKDERFQTWIAVDGGEQRLDRDMRLGRVLKQCHEILANRKYGRDTTFAILSRVEQLGRGYPNLAAFHRKLKQTLLPEELEKFRDFDAQVHCGTVHSFKGLEADVVVVLGVNERNFPKIHPDNELYSVLGVTASDVLAEEERLFYVAITRAKADLYLLTETDRESVFLSRLTALAHVNSSPAPLIASSGDCFPDGLRF